MAYASLSSLAQTTHQILNHDQYPISDHEKRKFTMLCKQVISLREAFDKFPKQASSLEARISAAANKAEDFIEHFMCDQIEPPANNPHQLHHRQLEKAMKEISSISREAANFTGEGDSSLKPSSRASSKKKKKLAHAASGGNAIGLDDDLIKIADLLTGGASRRRIVPIVGMGGIGKTTLARKIYQHQLITETFELCAWVTVSQEYETENVLSNILKQFEKAGVGRFGEENECLEERVHKNLKGRRYLIVLDDLWSRNAWDGVSNCFPDDNNGSRIVITTRHEDVATYVDSYSHFHRVPFLTPGQSWDLLKQSVFRSRDCPSDLVEIGVGIAEMCGGLPLAVVLVAGILSSVRETRSSWVETAKKVKKADSIRDKLEKIISLSYTDLPHHLRPCFLYMGAFPEDYDIRVSKLTRLWMAEGFVEREEEAVEYLEDLVKRSLVLVKRRKSDGKIKSCSLHDMVHDVCRRRAKKEKFEHRVSVARPNLGSLARTIGSTLRSIICCRSHVSLMAALPVFRLLRVLDVVGKHEHPLPARVFELVHLRYLAFGYLDEIPTAISRLRNLRTLIISSSKRHKKGHVLLYLPVEIWTMPQLIHLVSFHALLPDPEGVAAPLETLLTLSIVRRFVCSKEMIEMIPNVKKLGITYCGDEYRGDCQLDNLVFLHRLEKVKLVIKSDYTVPRDPVLPVFPETLRKLTLSGWRFPWTYMETIASLPNLQVLKLRDHACRGGKWETKEDQFPSLEFLEIDKSNLKNWVTEQSHFPRLKSLVLLHCSWLREIPSDIGDIPTLELIKVSHCNGHLVDCVKRIQKEQHDDWNNDLQVHCGYKEELQL